MTYIIGILTLFGAAYFWLNRTRNAADAATDVVDLGRDAIGSIRQWRFKRRTNVHPIDQIEDPRLAAGVLVVALTELAGPATEEQTRALIRAAQSHLDMSHEEARELLVLGHWMIQQSPSLDAALHRVERRMRSLGAAEMLDPALEVFREQVAAGSVGLTDGQREALAEVARQFHRR